MSESDAIAGKSPRRRPWQKKKKKKKGDSSSEDEEPAPPALPYTALFRYATMGDKLCLLLGVVAAVLHGTQLPVLIVIFGDVVDAFGGTRTGSPPELIAESLARIQGIVKWFLVMSFVAMALGAIQVRFSMTAANRIGYRIRLRYFNSLLRQDPRWIETKTSGELTSVINDVAEIEGGVGDKVATATQHITTFIVGIIIALARGWRLALVIIAVTPLLLGSGALIGMLSANATAEGQKAYAEAGGIANEVLSLVRIVAAYGGQEEEARRYEKALKKAFRANLRREVLAGASLGFVMLCVLSIYGLAFFYGAQLAGWRIMTAGQVLQVFFAVSLGATALGQAAPSFKSFAAARGTAPRIFEVIERKSPIDPLDGDAGRVLDTVRGEVEFRDVDFAYRNQMPPNEHLPQLVFKNFDLRIAEGTTQALVGPSGCGKSTSVKLIERFYDPNDGSVTLDGVDLRELNVRWLRSQIGYVGQMPTLFMLTIRDNIAMGAAPVASVDPDTGKRTWEMPKVSDAEIVEAARMANAHDFIMNLPEGYDTMLGERGAMLSGGQKQRICIARALVRNPKILILDEATAALDANSERVVQDALENASAGRTTITIAHRLSTVRNADRICVVDEGAVVEAGTHDVLMSIEGGRYRELVELQNVMAKKHAAATVQDDDESALLEDPLLAKRRQEQKSISKVDSTTKVYGPDQEDAELPVVDSGVLRRTFILNAKESLFIILGVIGAAMGGVAWPISSIVLVKMTELMMVGSTLATIRVWSLAFVGIGAGAFVGHLLHNGSLGVSGERLTLKLRAMTFRALLRQEMGYFDRQENSVGSLTTRLSREAALVKGITGETLGAVASVIASLASGLIIAFVNCWRVALVVLAIMPGVVIGGYLEMQMAAGLDSGSSKKLSASGRIASEATDNIVTVRSLGSESHFDSEFEKSLTATRGQQIRKANITAIAFGFSEFCQYLIWYAAFKAGADFVRQGHCTFFELLQSVMAVLFAAITLGNVAMFFPDIGASRVAATSIYRLLDRKSEIDPANRISTADNAKAYRGDVEADKMRFEYPSRPDVAVLRGLTVDVMQGQNLALVGASGCGKSTIVNLLERFYDVRTGVLNIDGKDVKTLDLQILRSNLGIVTQDPDLFNRSVRDNIVYGLAHVDGVPVTEELIVRAAEAANAHEFIQKLPEGYDTIVGPRGDKLSGGQRQRVAIARSLIREPKVLLLDEATSALDAVSEKIVQDALDNAAHGRTTITIAHRLSTVRNADIIAVVHKGKIAEQGTHTELLRLNGRYAELVKNQITDIGNS